MITGSASIQPQSTTKYETTTTDDKTTTDNKTTIDNKTTTDNKTSTDDKTTTDNIDEILERERQQNKRDNWVKLGKPAKIQRLHAFSETYGKEHSMPAKDVKQLKNFFINCLDKNKLNKTKDVVYNKEDMKIISIPALHFNKLTHNFTLKITDVKRVSTLKSLTPKRVTTATATVDV